MKTAKEKQIRCAIYTRKSNDDGLDLAFTSLEAQREAAESYIASQKANGWVLLPQHYDDAAYSGGNLNRPAMKMLLADCEAGLVDVIVTYKVDRLSRSLCDFADLSRKFERWGVSFVSVTQQIDTSSSAGKMLLNLLMTFAEYERQISSERIRDKFRASKMKGMWMGGTVPFGYRVKDRHLIVVPEEAEIVRRVFRRYVEIQSPKQIALELSNDGITTKRGLRWEQQGLLRMLHNCIYIGMMPYKDEVYQGQHEAIVDKEAWEAVQGILADNRPRSDADRTRSPSDVPMLKGLLTCGHCGGSMSPYSTYAHGRKYLYYRCLRDTRRIRSTCPLRQISSVTIEDAVLERLTAVFRTPEIAASLAGMSGQKASAVMRFLDENFWKEVTTVERNRIVELLVAAVTLYEDRLNIEIRTEGLECAMEEIDNECN